jgi:hypothetical protein
MRAILSEIREDGFFEKTFDNHKKIVYKTQII